MKVQNKKQMDKLSQQGSVFTKVEKGDMTIRVIGDIEVVKEHPIKVKGKFRAIACPTENARMKIAAGVSQETEVPPCPLCELGYPVKTTYLAKIVEREYEDKGEIVAGEASVLKKGFTLLGEVQNLFDDENWGKEGNYDIKVKATGDGFERKYSVLGIPADKSKPLSVREQESLKQLEEKVNLEEMTTPHTYKEIQEIIGEDYPDYTTVKAKEAEDNEPF